MTDSPKGKASAWSKHQQEIGNYEKEKRSKHNADIERIRKQREERMQAMLQGKRLDDDDKPDGYSTGSTKDTPIEGNSKRGSKDGNGEKGKDGISMGGAITVAVAINKLKARQEARKRAAARVMKGPTGEGPGEAVAAK